MNFQSAVVKFNNLTFGKLIQKGGLNGFFSKIQLPMNASFLEIGCKDGYAIQFIKQYFTPKSLIGIDIDKKSLETARKKILENHLENVKLEVADAQNLPFKNGEFDAIFMFATLHHILDWKKAINEVKRALKKDGYFIFREPLAKFYKLPLTKYFDKPAALFNKEELEQVLNLNNLKITYFNWRGFYKKFFHSSIEVVCQKNVE
jgi:ubiquinone/menaquinone biosynthesis C-methylase UbiE